MNYIYECVIITAKKEGVELTGVTIPETNPSFNIMIVGMLLSGSILFLVGVWRFIFT